MLILLIKLRIHGKNKNLYGMISQHNYISWLIGQNARLELSSGLLLTVRITPKAESRESFGISNIFCNFDISKILKKNSA